MKAYIEAIGLNATGLESWLGSQTILTEQEAYQATPLSKYSASFLPANERRRATKTVNLALRTAEETVQHYSQDAIQQMPTLFACVDGDTEISAKMTTAILMEQPMISPIHFHNSVHNAPAGYWMIGQRNRQAASAISAGQYQLANTFIETLTQLSKISPKVLLVAYDSPIDPVIKSYQPQTAPFSFGLVLSLHQNKKSIAKFTLNLQQQQTQTNNHPWFGENMAAQFLPILQAIAQKKDIKMSFPLSSHISTQINIHPLTKPQI